MVGVFYDCAIGHTGVVRSYMFRWMSWFGSDVC